MKLRYRNRKIEELHEQFMGKAAIALKTDEGGNKNEAKALLVELLALLMRMKDAVKESSDHNHSDPNNCLKHFSSIGTWGICQTVYSGIKAQVNEEEDSEGMTLEDLLNNNFDSSEVN